MENEVFFHGNQSGSCRLSHIIYWINTVDTMEDLADACARASAEMDQKEFDEFMSSKPDQDKS